jgi:spermidine synthase
MGKFLIGLFLISGVYADNWVSEGLYKDWKQSFKVERSLYEDRSEYQDLMIFENNTWGRVLVLDGIIQLTEKDEFVYHEMMAHVPLMAHKNPEAVLVIGGGDGGIVREVLKHASVKKVTLVEIDGSVIEFSKKYLSFVSQGAFQDPRVEVVIQDGVEFIKEAQQFYDVILCDSSDPEGPSAVLFTEEFYGFCKNHLNEGGIFVNQSGVPASQPQELQMIYKNLKPHFPDVTFYLAVIPTYVGGSMALSFCVNGQLDEADLESQRVSRGLKTKYYNAAMHKASFALPNTVLELLR